MELSRFYCNPITKPDVSLDPSQGRHLACVMRLKAGEKVELFDGSGGLAEAQIKSAGTNKVVLQVEEIQTVPRPFSSQIVIAASIAKGERFDWLISKCTELGVDRICPVLFDRTVKQPKNPKICQRWERLIIEAAKQCRRLYLPQIDVPAPLTEVLKTLKKDYPHGRFMFGCLSARSRPLAGGGFSGSDAVAFVGTEGGMTAQEESLLLKNGFMPVRLTETTLRIETAAIAFAAVLAAQRIAGNMETI